MQTDQMKIRDFHILSDAQTGFKPIDACCQFLYKGFQISISTSGLSQGACQTPVCIFDGFDYQDVFQDGFSTVQDAIKYVDDTVYVRDLDKDVLKQIQQALDG